jgi:hypothetical protein
MNTLLQPPAGSEYQGMERTEHMFNMLNRGISLRKYSPILCKFLVNVTGFFHACRAVQERCGYPLEQVDFTGAAGAAIGPSIAFPLLQPAAAHSGTGIRTGKG